MAGNHLEMPLLRQPAMASHGGGERVEVHHVTRLRVATAGLDLLADALEQQGTEVTRVAWAPPAAGDIDAVRDLTALYGDDRVDAANVEAVARLQAAEPEVVDAGAAGRLIPGLEGKMVLHAGPPVEPERMCRPQRLAIAGAALLEGWADGLDEALGQLDAGAIGIAPAHSLGAAGAMTGIISPSMAVWHVRNATHGIDAWSPLNDGPGDAFWLGVATPESVARQRELAEIVAPAFSAALKKGGPVSVFPLNAEGIAMGDDCHMRHQATTMLLLRRLLPDLAEAAPGAVRVIAERLGANGHFALTMTIAACRSALASIRGIPHCSLVTFISRNGTDAAVELAGLPGRWFTAPALMVGDPLYRPGFGDADAALDIGDSALVECCGLGAAASASSPSVAAFLGGGLADAIARTRAMARICVAESERFRIPTLDGEGTPLGVDARACVDLGETPLINTGILHAAEGGQIGAGVARAPLDPFRAAVGALAALA
jgi:hypothetical protein